MAKETLQINKMLSTTTQASIAEAPGRRAEKREQTEGICIRRFETQLPATVANVFLIG